MRIVDNVFNSVSLLSIPQQGFLACLVVEKMEPNFVFYSQNAKEINKVKAILNDCFNNLLSFSNINDHLIISDHLESIKKLIPNLDNEFGAASYAFDFCIALSALLEFLKKPNIQEIEIILEQAIATVDMYIQEYLEIDPSDPELDDKIIKNKFMVREIERQRTLLEVIQNIEFINLEQIDRIRNVNNSLPNMIDLTAIY